MPKLCFLRLCDFLEHNGVRDTRPLSVKEQVMMFLIVVGHCDSTDGVATNGVTQLRLLAGTSTTFARI